MMGLFDSVLICSDLDGTLAHNEEILPKNKEAISYFMEEGGKFCISSGRSASYLDRIASGMHLNAPYISINGTQIYNPQTKEIYYKAFLNPSTRYLPLQEMNAFGWEPEAHHHFFLEGDRNIIIEGNTLPKDFSSYEHLGIYKIVHVFKDPNEAERYVQFARARYPEYQFVRSWPVGVEQLDRSAGKGVCVQKLKELLHVTYTVGIGDQENDLSMLQAADFAFCPQNAVPEVKAQSREVLCDFREGAIEHLIRVLPHYIKNT